MKTLVLFCAAFLLTFNLLIAQDANTSTPSNQQVENEYSPADYYPFGVGLAFAFKGGVNVLDSPGGVKNGYVFTAMPDIGAQVYVPFGTDNNMGIVLDLAYITYPYKFKLYSDEDVNWVDKLSYFTIAPNFHISGFMFGFNLGIPMAAESDNKTTDGNKFKYDYEKDNMKFLVDVHIGALIPLVKSDFGRLNLYIQAEYALSDVFENDLVTQSDIHPNATQDFNIQPAALKFGLSYIFNTGLMQK
jgi:hypothetical protein